MHGTGNDFVIIDCRKAKITKPAILAKNICNRHFGVGSDGLILIKPSRLANAQMQMFNPDGSQSKMCGNGLRCVARYLSENFASLKKNVLLTIESHSIVYKVKISRSKNTFMATVNMGKPCFDSSRIPTSLNKANIINHPVKFAKATYNITCVNMGNPHAVIYTKDIEKINLQELGPIIENARIFPLRTNVEFVQIISKNEVIQRTWERGCGETLACGSGASAVCAAGVKTGKTNGNLKIHLKGGTLEISWDGLGDLFLTGPTSVVFKGTYLS